MRIEIPYDTERFGAVLIHGVQKVFELDAGLLTEPAQADRRSTLERISYQSLHDIEKEMAIIVPMRNERIKLVQGVLTGIPHHCLTIIVSNSPREPVDRFALERDAFERFSRFIGKEVVVVHQKDLAVAEAFQKVGYTAILDEKDGLVKDGKAEGMIVGTLLARLSNRRYIGFIDADNYFPGAVLEYVHEYAAGFFMSKSPHTMVRISWHSKPKIIEDGSLFFAKWGRTSRNTNKFLNMLLAEYTGFETEIIKTGNAGEHAMTMDLAMILNYSSGYSIEPYHYINLFEQFGGIPGTVLKKEMIHQPVEVFQIESRNPHMHDADKGDEHIQEMTYAAMQVIYHSPICLKKLKERLLKELDKLQQLEKGEKPLPVSYYPPLADLDLDKFLAAVRTRPYARVLVDAQSQLKPLSKPDQVIPKPLSPVTTLKPTQHEA